MEAWLHPDQEDTGTREESSRRRWHREPPESCPPPSSPLNLGTAGARGNPSAASERRWPLACSQEMAGCGEDPRSLILRTVFPHRTMGDSTTVRCELEWMQCWAQRRHALILEPSLAPSAPGALQTWGRGSSHLNPVPQTSKSSHLQGKYLSPFILSLDKLGPPVQTEGVTAHGGPFSPLTGALLAPHRLSSPPPYFFPSCWLDSEPGTSDMFSQHLLLISKCKPGKSGEVP